jgi:uncharacterized SAM-binding protein YcdF (DUF218 family)
MSWRRRWLTAAQATILVVVVLAIDVAVSGFLVFANARTDDLRQADAIIVLGGEHDGREDYGLSLAREGWAPTVVISNPYDDWDPVMKRVCRPAADVEVICARPDPLTTRGEAVLMQRLALERNWSRIIVVSWRYHLPRARLVFEQCFSDRPGSTVMVSVPRRYRYSLFRWEFVFAYQWAGLAKALAQGECS